MLPHRKALLIGSMVLVVGTLSATLGYAFHLRSDSYRRQLEQDLSDRLRMRLSIGDVSPLTLASRRLTDIRLWRQDREIEVFRCSQAVWRSASRNGISSYSLDLERGWLLVGDNEWNRSDYREMLRSGLGHDFAALRLEHINLRDIDLIWKHPGFTLTADAASGQIRFDDDGTGRASLFVKRMNGVDVDEPLKIVAHFTPGDRLEFHDVVLTVPQAPLGLLKLDALLGNAVTRGTFAGNISYKDRNQRRIVTLGGAVHDATLMELTGPLPGGPYQGIVDVDVDEATFTDAVLTRLRFSGALRELNAEQLTSILSLPKMGGRLDLRVHQAVYENNTLAAPQSTETRPSGSGPIDVSGKVSFGALRYLSAEGHLADVSLDAVTELFGQGRITGTADISIHSILVVDSQIQLADVTIDARPPKGQPGTIDRRILKSLAQRTLGFDPTALLPEDMTHVEYTRLGVRLILNRGQLRVQGTHGPDNRTILTINLFGRDFGVIKQPNKTFPVGDVLSKLRERIEDYDTNRLREWWQTRRPTSDE